MQGAGDRTVKAAGVRVGTLSGTGGWQGMIPGGPSAIRSPPGESAALKGKVLPSLKSHLELDL